MLNFIRENYTLFIVILGTAILGLSNGALGVFNILRKNALVGDALSHATLPGVVLAFILTQNKSMEILLIGAAISAVLAMFLLNLIKKYSKIKNDAALALILSSFFGLGQVFLIVVQNSGNAAQAGLNRLIFGQAATMLIKDILIMGIASILIIVLILLFWKELKLFIFNDEYFQSLGYSRKVMNSLITIMTVTIVVISIRTVGVILMSALLIAPGVSARLWSNKLNYNVIIASVIGLVSGVLGTILSANQTNLPTGPIVVIVLSFFVLSSLLFSPKKGLIKSKLDIYKHNKLLKDYKPLIHLYSGNEIKIEDLNFYKTFVTNNYIEVIDNTINLTQKGIDKVEKILVGDIKWI